MYLVFSTLDFKKTGMNLDFLLLAIIGHREAEITGFEWEEKSSDMLGKNDYFHFGTYFNGCGG